MRTKTNPKHNIKMPRNIKLIAKDAEGNHHEERDDFGTLKEARQWVETAWMCRDYWNRRSETDDGYRAVVVIELHAGGDCVQDWTPEWAGVQRSTTEIGVTVVNWKGIERAQFAPRVAVPPSNEATNLPESFRTAAEDLKEAIVDITLGSIETVVLHAALNELIDSWNDHVTPGDGDEPIDASEARRWIDVLTREDYQPCRTVVRPIAAP